ncbi:hypothetical protein IMSAGC019_03400 [Lachnospiraceae bacterium]|nr:hypothetical protein IMSAGC019_03400 [Lachnospiraceae bacterium]
MQVSIKSRYDNEILDRIFRYFMRIVLHMQSSGIEKLPLENNFEEPLKSFIDIAVGLIIDGQPPEIASLILDAEYDVILNTGAVSVKTAMSLRLIKELSLHIHYDDYYSYLLSTDNLWGNEVSGYASQTFYPNLPEEIKEKYKIHDLIKYMPKEAFRLDDY